ncbi:MAG: dipeptidase [Gemmatimonadaceae bacterium]|nr:dipeptidase [Gemmatimonadaceae bacterium]NUO94797.1 dipeptidase [Gemmatimonadaceae bacterium]NUP69863.1 dipeptidase [Gemmatimonadaceae bacterium]NUS32858.1 dipeptidase [Gemmatimonadaceae bacterium]NUS48290.1 dipeptidase [Gemmatimonadaceae bacterium]
MTSMSAVSTDLDAYLSTHDARIQRELFDLLRIPSVSARSEHDADTARAAEWVAQSLRDAGLEASVHPTGGHPVVVGEWRGAGAGAPTVLVYGHYDVQPAEPLELWTSPAFEPTIRDGKLFARGSVDDKGQLFLHVKALEAHLKARGRLPVNVIVLAEGEEEVGSEHLAGFIEANAARLQADAVVISDSAMFAPGLPSILSSLRGLAYFQIDVQGPAQDLHSGSYGGAVVNPAMALARILATMHDADGRIAIPGFYDAVHAWDARVLEQMRGLPFDEEHFRAEAGSPALGGEKGYTVLERLWTRPTCEVNGLLSGYTGEGAKTVLPAKAMAKVSCRLVPDQDPAAIEALMKAHVARVAPKGVTVTVTHLHGGRPWRAELAGPLFDAARRALAAAFGREPVITGEGGSIPVVGDFQRILGAPVLLVGFGLPGENAHAPDEWMSVENFTKGMRAIAALWDELGTSTGRTK